MTSENMIELWPGLGNSVLGYAGSIADALTQNFALFTLKHANQSKCVVVPGQACAYSVFNLGTSVHTHTPQGG
jgi:hypothetical protein